MKSSIILTAAWTLNLAIFAALLTPAEKNTPRVADPNDFEVTGILLPEVVISSMPTYELPAIIVRSTTDADSMSNYTLPEVTIIAKGKPRA